MNVPIIIINWNGIEDTIECISSVKNMVYNEYHIYLIDNGSQNQEGHKLERLYSNDSKITVIQNNHNYGFTKAHIDIWENEIQKQSYKYIVLLNNDTVVDANWLQHLISFAEIQKIDVVSSKMIDFYKRDLMDNAGHQMLNTGEIIPIGFSKSIDLYNNPIENIGACAGACLYRTSMLHKIGFFDPYFTTGYEDAEFGLRAKIAGFKLKYNPNAIVYHKRGKSIKKVFNTAYSEMIQTAILYTYFKLVPFPNIIISLPSIIVKNLSILIVDLVFKRWGYLSIWKQSWINVYKNRKMIRAKRREFYQAISNKTIPFYSFISKTKFFLGFDIERFWRIIILKRQSALDQY